jgi:DNA-binding winged helix-turn-helix (wHTH) protein/TolB-like protein
LEVFRLGALTLQPHRQLLADGERVPLGKRALDILSVLADARGEIVTKDEMLEAVWPGIAVEENALQVHVVALRKALGAEAHRLKTIRGIGYQLDLAPGTQETAEPSSSMAVTPGGATDKAGAGTVRPVPSGAGSVRQTALPWAHWRWRQWGALAAMMIVALAGAWLLSGGAETPQRSGERIPVVVRALTASASGDTAEAALAAGITDELIVRLRRIPDLRVATAEANGSVPSDAFNQAYIVDGRIRSNGDKLRVTARLFRQDGEILWSQTFNRGFADLFDVQEEIAAAISNALSVSFDVGGNSADYGGTDNPEAYAAYMQYYSRQLDPEFDSKPYLERAVALDPHYAKARAALSGVYGLQISLVPTKDKARLLTEMERSTRAALAANPGLWIPEAGRGMYDVYRNDLVSAGSRFERVASLDRGNDPELRSFVANFHMLLGRVRKAASIRQSNELIDPIQRNDPFRIYDYEMLGQYQQSIDLFARLERREQRDLDGFILHAYWSYKLLGRDADAARFAEQRGYPEFVENTDIVRSDKSLAGKSLGELRTWANKRFGEGAEFSLAFAALDASFAGQPELAVNLMRPAFEQPSGGALFTLWHPAMAPARKTDAFERLVTDLGIVKAWRASGDWGDFCRPVTGGGIACQ